jgi:hypothetical protein
MLVEPGRGCTRPDVHAVPGIHYARGMRSPFRILALLGALAAVVVGALLLHRSAGVPVHGGPPARGKAGAPEESAGEDVVGRALRLAAIDSTHKRDWVDDIPDLDLAALTPEARETFLRIANGRRCTCGCGFTLAGCRRFDSECEVSGPRAGALYDSVRAGRIARADGFRRRPAKR